MNLRRLQESDHADWLVLWQGYLSFYQAQVSPEQTQRTWLRLLNPAHALQGFAALEEDSSNRSHKLAGFAICCIRPSTWSDGGYCYLEDLFVDPLMRGRGMARQLIEHCAQWATAQGADSLYWLTQETNYSGRMLYDKLASRSGFIHYKRKLPNAPATT